MNEVKRTRAARSDEEADMDQELTVLGAGAILAPAAGLLWLWALVDKVRENQDTFIDVLRRIGRHRRRQGMHRTDFMDR